MSPMIENLIVFCIVALIAYLVWMIIGKFIGGVPHQIIGIIIALVLLLYALRIFRVLDGVRLWAIT